MLRLTPVLLLAALAHAAPPPDAPPVDGPLSVERALALARTHHPRLRAANGSAEVAAGQVDSAFSPFLPQLSLALGYQRATGNPAPRPGVPAGSGVEPSFEGFNYFSASLTLNQLIWDFGQTLNRWRAAEATFASTRAQIRAARLDVELAVRVAFVNAWGARALVRVAAENVAAEERHLGQVRAFVGAEARPAVELAKSRAQLAAAQAQLISANGAVDAALAQLQLAMGVNSLPSRELADLPLSPHPAEAIALDTLVAQALKARPEFQSLELQQEAQRRLSEAASGAYWPTFGLTLAVTDAGTELTSLGWNMSAGVGLTWNFYQGGLTDGQVRQAEAVLEVLAANVESTRQALRAELAQVLIELQTARAQLDAAEEGLRQASEQVRLAEGRYQARVGSIIELADAETARANAATNVVVVRFRIALARARLLRAIGDGADDGAP